MARILSEFLEAAVGYDLGVAWTEGVDGGSTVNEDAVSSGAGSPSGWGSQCLLIDHITVTNSYTYNIFGATAIVFLAVELKVSAQSMGGGDALLLYLTDATLATGLFAVRLAEDSGVTYIEAVQDADGDTVFTVAWREPLVLDKLYRFEFKWDTTNDRWSIWVNGILFGDGALTGAAATTLAGTILIGSTASNVGAFTARVDSLLIDNSTRIGPDNFPLIDYSKFPIEKLAAGPRRLLA